MSQKIEHKTKKESSDRIFKSKGRKSNIQIIRISTTTKGRREKRKEKNRKGKGKKSKNREEGISNAVIQGKFSALKDMVF